MINQQLLGMLRCPQDGTALTIASPQLINDLNQRVLSGMLVNEGGTAVTQSLSGGLVREAGDLLYPIFDDIPVMLRDEAVDLGAVDSTPVG